MSTKSGKDNQPLHATVLQFGFGDNRIGKKAKKCHLKTEEDNEALYFSWYLSYHNFLCWSIANLHKIGTRSGYIKQHLLCSLSLGG